MDLYYNAETLAVVYLYCVLLKWFLTSESDWKCSSAWCWVPRWLTLGRINSHSRFLSERIRDQIQCFWLLWDASVWQSESSTVWICSSTLFPLDFKSLLCMLELNHPSYQNYPSLWEVTSWSFKWMESFVYTGIFIC